MLANEEIRDVLLESELRGFALGHMLPVHLIMAADIQQDDFLVRNGNGQCDSIAIGDADSLSAFELAAEMVIFQMWLERIVLQIAQDIGELCP